MAEKGTIEPKIKVRLRNPLKLLKEMNENVSLKLEPKN